MDQTEQTEVNNFSQNVSPHFSTPETVMHIVIFKYQLVNFICVIYAYGHGLCTNQRASENH